MDPATTTRTDGLLVVDRPVLRDTRTLVDEDDGTYVETDMVFSQTTTHTWNHGLGETVGAVLEAGMELTVLDEHRSVPWEALPGHMVRDEHEEWHLKERPERLPLTYTLQARKPTR